MANPDEDYDGFDDGLGDDDFDEEEEEEEFVDMEYNPWSKEAIIAWCLYAFSYENLKATSQWLLDQAKFEVSIKFDDIMMLMTVFALFGDDIRTIHAPKSYDQGFNVVTTIVLACFIFELVLNSWSKSSVQRKPFKIQGYLFSFYFWLDLIAIISLFPDVPSIAQPTGMDILSQSGNNSNYSRAGKVVRMVRLVRIVRLYKIQSERRKEEKYADEVERLVMQGVYTPEEGMMMVQKSATRQSKVGAELSDTTTKRVIVLILIMLILIPILKYVAPAETREYALEMAHDFNLAGDSTQLTAFREDFFDNWAKNLGQQYILKWSVEPTDPDTPFYDTDKIDELRDYEIVTLKKSSVVGGITYTTEMMFNMHPFIAQQALMNGVVMTIFVTCMLVLGAMVLANDAQKLVLDPIERMMLVVERVAEDPLRDTHVDQRGKPGAVEADGAYETKLLENTIDKITGLLRVGFGEAGAGIIKKNLSLEDSSGVIDPLIAGKRVYAIFGFCDIHHFEDVIEKLEGEVMRFVNSIADVVHQQVSIWSGQNNKNLGNAFLMVWRIGDAETVQSFCASVSVTKFRSAQSNLPSPGRKFSSGPSMSRISDVGSSSSSSSTPGIGRGATNTNLLDSPAGGGGGAFGASRLSSNNLSGKRASSGDLSQSAGAGGAKDAPATPPTAPSGGGPKLDLRRIPGIDSLSDQALIGFCKVNVELLRNKRVIAWSKDPRLKDENGQDFVVRMGFGLHAGWAIEGAVGSLQKVDCTYLSPHVNMSARMETASKQYKVAILCTDDFYQLMSSAGQSKCRRLDIVTVKGSEVPIPIYTYDTLLEQTFAPRPLKNKRALNTNDNEYSDEIWSNDPELLQLRRHITPEFERVFAEALALYLSGDWPNAKGKFEAANELMEEWGGDGTCQTLLRYMEARDFTAPSSWKGFRPLTSK